MKPARVGRVFVMLVTILAGAVVASGAAGADARVVEEWAARFDSPRSDGDNGDYGMAVGVDAGGNVYVAGNNGVSTQNGYVPDFQVVKYDGAGNQVWARAWDRGSRLDDWVSGLAVQPTGASYVTGVSYKDVAEQDGDIATIGYSPSGRRRWVRIEASQGGRYDHPFDMTADDAGNVYLTGVWSGYGIYDTDAVTIKYDSSGIRLWLATYNGPGHYTDTGNAIAVDGAGNVFVAGSTWTDASQWDYLVLKYDPAGHLLWARTYDATQGFDVASAVAVDEQGNVYITGTANTGPYPQGRWDDIGTVKYDSNGNRKWVRLFSAVPEGTDEGADLALDPAGNVYVTGVSFRSYQNDDYTTIKYTPSGGQAWVAHYDGPEYAQDHDEAVAVECLPDGGVAVTGYAGPLYNTDYTTVKYSSSTGSELWAARYDGYPGTTEGSDIARHLAVDPAGGIYVTGESAGGPTGWDIATIEYSDT